MKRAFWILVTIMATGLAIVALIMTAQVLATMSPSAAEQFGKVASIAVIMTLLPYIYSAVAIKIIGRGKLNAHQGVFYAIVGLIAALYSMAAMIGSDPAQTRWALMFVIFTIILYEMSINRQLQMQGKDEKITCLVPSYVRHLTLLITIAALILTFWISFKDEHHLKTQIKGHFPTVTHSETLG